MLQAGFGKSLTLPRPVVKLLQTCQPALATGKLVGGECDGLVHKLKAIPDLDITLAQASSKILVGSTAN